MATIGFEPHDHGHCVAEALMQAEEACREKGLRLTPVRRRSLELLLAEHRAIGAYDLLKLLSAEGFGAQPPVAYRALDFLVNAGFAHKIEALNAFIACAHLGQCDRPAFLICTKCGSVAEAETGSADNRLTAAADAAGFAIKRTVEEAEGICPACQNSA